MNEINHLTPLFLLFPLLSIKYCMLWCGLFETSYNSPNSIL